MFVSITVQLLSRAAAANARLNDIRQTTTTGSIYNNSDQLSVALAADFRSRNSVIVEIGREAGQGQRGTRGVGGTWPAKSYATEAVV